MADFDYAKNISKPMQGAIIIMLILAFIVAFIPLWQIGAAAEGTSITATGIPFASAEGEEDSIDDSAQSYQS